MQGVYLPVIRPRTKLPSRREETQEEPQSAEELWAKLEEPSNKRNVENAEESHELR